MMTNSYRRGAMLEQLNKLCAKETNQHYIAPFFGLHPGDTKQILIDKLRKGLEQSSKL